MDESGFADAVEQVGKVVDWAGVAVIVIGLLLIIRTVAVSPTFRSVGVLGAIVLVRTFLSFTLEVELEGRWPWQRQGQSGPSG